MQRDFRDSYLHILDWAGKSPQEFIELGLEASIWPDAQGMERVDAMWEALKQRVLHGGDPVHIRGYGRDAGPAQWYLDLYRDIFPNAVIKKAGVSNLAPHVALSKLTGSKRNEDILNYEVCHIIPFTRNPFLFECPWNVIWIPKVFEPLTGPNAKGQIPGDFRQALLLEQNRRFGQYVDDYNRTMTEAGATERARDWLTGWQPESSVSARRAAKFRMQALVETSTLSVLDQA